jgi:hypothetical protein
MSDVSTIVVSAFCQTPGMAATLQNIFPKAKIYAVPVVGALKESDGFGALLQTASAWINSESDESRQWAAAAKGIPTLKYVNVPMIGFHAFQPDMCAAIDSSTGQNARQKYSSKIGVWAYRQGLNAADAAQFFNARTFRSLGYFECWDESVAQMKARFGASDVADFFQTFYLRVKRVGQFMHTTTHPMALPLTLLGKIAAIKIGAPKSVLDETIQLSDSLAHLRWPVYPEIAANLSLPTTGYIWKMHQATLKEDLCIRGVEEFLEYCFAHYHAQGIAPQNIGMSGIDLDEVSRRIES